VTLDFPGEGWMGVSRGVLQFCNAGLGACNWWVWREDGGCGFHGDFGDHFTLLLFARAFAFSFVIENYG